MRSGRGIGYCLNPSCERYSRASALRKGDESYVCSRCEWTGHAEFERGHRQGRHRIVSEVRVEFGFDPDRGIYTESVVVGDDRLLRSQSVYVLQTPFVKSHRVALDVGRAVLKRLNEKAFSPHLGRLPSREELRAQGWSTLV